MSNTPCSLVNRKLQSAAHSLLYFCIRQRRQLHTSAVLSPIKKPHYPEDGRLGEHQSQSGPSSYRSRTKVIRWQSITEVTELQSRNASNPPTGRNCKMAEDLNHVFWLYRSAGKESNRYRPFKGLLHDSRPFGQITTNAGNGRPHGPFQKLTFP